MLWCPPPFLVSPGNFNSRSCPHWASCHSSATVYFSYPGPGSHIGFCKWVSALINRDSLYSYVCLSSLGAAVVCPVSFPLSQIWVVNILVCSVFVYLLLRRSGDSTPSTCETRNQKSSFNFFNQETIISILILSNIKFMKYNKHKNLWKLTY